MATSTASTNAGKRILEVRVEEATGCNKDSQRTWDSDITEGFIKAAVPHQPSAKEHMQQRCRDAHIVTQQRSAAEVRGESNTKPQKAVTKTVKVSPDVKMTWKEPLYLELTESSTELRLLLCREKAKDSGKRNVTVVTACGIFVHDIQEAAPIDKYFEMFKPGSGTAGGFVRLKMSLLSDDELVARQQAKSAETGKKGPLKPLALLATLAAAGFFTFTKMKGNNNKS